MMHVVNRMVIALSFFLMLFSCIWDVTTGVKKGEETGSHWGDVVSISLNPQDGGQTFITGSVDKTARLWDLRECKPKQMFLGHEADVNSVDVSSISFF